MKKPRSTRHCDRVAWLVTALCTVGALALAATPAWAAHGAGSVGAFACRS